jgi:hypothetical protein
VVGIIAVILVIAIVVFFAFSGHLLPAGMLSNASGSRGSGTGPAMGQCPANMTLCSGTCVDLKTDAENCGGCGYSVPDGETCIQGIKRRECKRVIHCAESDIRSGNGRHNRDGFRRDNGDRCRHPDLLHVGSGPVRRYVQGPYNRFPELRILRVRLPGRDQLPEFLVPGGSQGLEHQRFRGINYRFHVYRPPDALRQCLRGSPDR